MVLNCLRNPALDQYFVEILTKSEDGSIQNADNLRVCDQQSWQMAPR